MTSQCPSLMLYDERPYLKHIWKKENKHNRKRSSKFQVVARMPVETKKRHNVTLKILSESHSAPPQCLDMVLYINPNAINKHRQLMMQTYSRHNSPLSHLSLCDIIGSRAHKDSLCCQVEHHVRYIYIHKASPKWVKNLLIFLSRVYIHGIYYIVKNGNQI